ncbi:NUDIX hydrolase [Deferribacter thermophilus]|uniref:NUDIX hydrolase n=1 Tax=Deferribacter thermophilus TaxID=53573 RepID=UPI003C263800
MNKHWQLLKIEQKYQDHVLGIEHKHFKFLKNGEQSPFCSIKTKNWVVIVPQTDDGKFILVKQFRFAIEDTTIEFPGGAIDYNEEPLKAAKRELQEETGFISDNFIDLGYLHPNPAILSNKCYIFAALNCKNTQKTNFDKFEDIEIELWDKDQLESAILKNEITHSIVVAAYTKFLLYNK